MNRKPWYRKFSIWCLLLLIAWIIMGQSCMQFRISDSAAKKNFADKGIKLTTQTIPVDGFDIHYAKAGDDTLPTIFFIHGSPGGWNAFEKYMQDKELLQKFRMISVDRPGFGYSEFGEAKNLEEQSKLISPLIDYFNNGKPFYLAGHSLGGPLCVRLCADHPDHVNGIIIISGSVSPKAEKPETWRGFVANSPLRYLLPGAMRPSNDEIWYLKKDLKILDTVWGRITCPVWFIHGENDKWVPLANIDYAKKKLINARNISVSMIPNEGHFIPWESYDIIKKVLMGIN